MKKNFLLGLVAAAFSLTAHAELSKTDFASNDYVKEWGRLKLVGLQLSSESGEAVQLRGWSTFGLQWTTECYYESHVEQMKLWGANIVRGAMYVAEGGYDSSPSVMTQKVKDLIDYTANKGMYYLCDWHTLSEGDPRSTSSKAQNFFGEITTYVKQKGYKHVLYEICNEPNGCSWSDIKEYANSGVLKVIEDNDPGAIVCVGTPQYDQLPDQAAKSPIEGYDNLGLMYSFHYYACSHTQFLTNLNNACATIPIFITETGWAAYDGNGSELCESAVNQLMNYANGKNDGKQKISWCNWSWTSKNELTASLTNCGNMSLSASGNLTVKLLGSDATVVVKKTSCYGNSCTKISKEGNYEDGGCILDLGFYDVNPEAEEEAIGGGEGVTYHEENTTADEDNDRSSCNGAFKWAGEDYNFRIDECVDASGCAGASGKYSEGWHNLGYIEPNEWEMYTLDVVDPGYYSLQLLVNPTTNQEVSITSYSYDCNLLVDMDNDDAALASISFDNEYSKDKQSEAYKYWEFRDPIDNLDDMEEGNFAVLFKEAGKHTIRITWGSGTTTSAAAGDAGPLKFKYVKEYTGEGYDHTATVDTKSNSNVEVYPNPANDVITVNVEASKIEVCSFTGAVLASANGNSVNIASLAAGSYIVKIETANGVVYKQIYKE